MKLLFILLSLSITITSFANGFGNTYRVALLGENEFMAETEGSFTYKDGMTKNEAQKKVLLSATRDLKKNGSFICKKLTKTSGLNVKIHKNQNVDDINDYMQCQSKKFSEVCSSIALVKFSCI